MKKILHSLNYTAQRHGFLISVTAVALVIAGYMIYELSFLLRRPNLVLDRPSGRFLIVREPFADISGRAGDNSKVYLNNRPIEVGNGRFAERLYLAAGANRIIIEAVNDRGKSIRRETFLVYTP